MANGSGHLGFISISGGGGGGGVVTISPVNQTPATTNISGASGSTPATYRSVTFVINQGTVDIDGVTYQEGSYSFGNDTFGTLASISYDATGSTDASILHNS